MYSVPRGTEIEIFRKVAPASAVPNAFHNEPFLMRNATLCMPSTTCIIGIIG